jgi:putative transcriptional regulator
VENIKIKIARVENQMSQQDLADTVGATRQTIGLIEKGKYNPSLKLCISIAKALGKTLDDLFWEQNQKP